MAGGGGGGGVAGAVAEAYATRWRILGQLYCEITQCTKFAHQTMNADNVGRKIDTDFMNSKPARSE